jgi:hypothetical protein
MLLAPICTNHAPISVFTGLLLLYIPIHGARFLPCVCLLHPNYRIRFTTVRLAALVSLLHLSINQLSRGLAKCREDHSTF